MNTDPIADPLLARALLDSLEAEHSPHVIPALVAAYFRAEREHLGQLEGVDPRDPTLDFAIIKTHPAFAKGKPQ